jgi:hypothetical protein
MSSKPSARKTVRSLPYFGARTSIAPAPTALHLTADVQRPGEEVDAADLRPGSLAEPRAGEGRKSHEGFEPWRRCCDD